jgi:hypothetical protein
MKKNIGLSLIVASSAQLSAANGQSPPPAAPVAKYDGKYAFVSATKVYEAYRTYGLRIGRCADMPPGPLLTIANGQAHYRRYTGIVGPQGELVMRLDLGPGPASDVGIRERKIVGRIDINGMVHARWSDYYCQYDFVWQKETK